MEDLFYFDNAATTFPKPEEVCDQMMSFYKQCGVNVGRGQHVLSSRATRLMEQTRQSLLRLLHAPNKQIVFAPTATEAINLLLINLVENNAAIYISPFEHNAVTRTLHHIAKDKNIKVQVLPFDVSTWQYDFSQIESLFKQEKPALLIVSHASNVTGYVSPIQKLCTLAKTYGSITLLDMCQTAGLIDTDLSSDIYDYAVVDGHKTLYGPFGIAGIIGKSFEKFVPLVYGGTGIESQNQDMPLAVPERLEAGSHNILAIAGLYYALEWISKQGVNKIFLKEQENKNRLLSILSSHSNIQIVSPIGCKDSIGIISCLFDGYASDNIGQVLSDHQIAVRTGLHCAPLAHKTIGTFPAGTVRFSISWFTSDVDFVALEEALTFIEENS